jgi:hypothetical protein
MDTPTDSPPQTGTEAESPKPGEKKKKGKKGVHWSKDLDILRRLESVSIMMTRGAKLFQIAESLGVSLMTATRDVARVKELRLRAVSEVVRDNTLESVANLRHIQSECWRRYEAKPLIRFLRLYLDCEKEIVALLGAHEPRRATVSGELLVKSPESKLVELLKQGRVKSSDVISEFGEELASQILQQAGIRLDTALEKSGDGHSQVTGENGHGTAPV